MEFNLLITSICFVFNLIYRMVQHTAYALCHFQSICYLPFNTNIQMHLTFNSIQFNSLNNKMIRVCARECFCLDWSIRVVYPIYCTLSIILQSVCLCHRNMHISTANSHLNAVSAILSIHRMRISLQHFIWLPFKWIIWFNRFSVCNWRLAVFLLLNGC